MKQNFFQAIGLADMEKIHSAVIGWMLSENCIAFDKEEKSKMPLFKEICKKYDGWKVNSPKTKPSLSLSLLGKEWYNNPQKDILAQWEKRYKIALEVQKSIIDKII